MSKPEADQINVERTNQTVEVEDLPVTTGAQQEVTGGNRTSAVPTGTVTFLVDGL